jgi:hypothetical protein
MLWSARNLIAKADGAQFHDRPDALFRNRLRQNELISAGSAVIRFTWEDTLSAVRLPAMVRTRRGGRRTRALAQMPSIRHVVTHR